MCKRIREDIAAVRQRDPAARSGFEILLMYAGVQRPYGACPMLRIRACGRTSFRRPPLSYI